MDRRTFIQLAAAPALSAASDLPSYPYRAAIRRAHGREFRDPTAAQ
jgi:hypothetical protein